MAVTRLPPVCLALRLHIGRRTEERSVRRRRVAQ